MPIPPPDGGQREPSFSGFFFAVLIAARIERWGLLWRWQTRAQRVFSPALQDPEHCKSACILPYALAFVLAFVLGFRLGAQLPARVIAAVIAAV
jgi:hypothetical protein